MIEKDLTKPIILLQHEAALRRLPANHRKREEIEHKRDTLNAGYKGEQRIQYFLSLLPEKRYHIFHDIRLPIGNSFFQIDALLLSPNANFIIEGKNNAGSLFLDKNQLAQEINSEHTIYQNPLTQVNRHKLLLNYLFEKYELPWPVFEHLVCISNQSATITISPGYHEAEKRVCKADNLLKKIDEYEKFYKKDQLDEKSIHKIKRFLLKKHTPNQINFLEKYDLGKSEILTGVQCPKCDRIGMNYQHGHWICPFCHTVSKNTHIQAIEDYFLLIKTSGNNAELREFLRLPSARIATYHLSQLHLSSTGTTKGKVYHQPF
ncbi:nuclease-related domain-containing protein [Neobacillus sp. SM06]|uniref:nuclease-related domain-containing protein n=1 Tax=Neobacillus sp. SM06 TaxID=3422492 RepID=UPI003D27996C